MGKFPFKRPRIISKKFPEMTSTIDGVKESLHGLVFSYQESVEKTLQKKHVMMAISSMVLLVVLGSFISPKGKAESTIFYPDTCLGGWVNPQHAQGEIQTTSNGDASQFTKENAAVLPKNTDAEMYCGHFKGKFDATTKPTKIIVSLALTKGDEMLLENTISSDPIASSSEAMLETASTTDDILTVASSTFATSTLLQATSSASNDSSSTDVLVESTSTPATLQVQDVATSTPSSQHSTEAPSSVLEGIVKSIQDTVDTLFDTNTSDSAQTDTVVVPQVQQNEAPANTETPPTSYLEKGREKVFSYFVQKVFAEESTSTLPTETVSSSTEITESVLEVSHTPEVLVTEVSTSSLHSTSTEVELVNASSTNATTTYATTTEVVSEIVVATSTEDDNDFQNNFLEVLYTFDGVTWTSLGSLNDISMKYRTFEIPVTASTTWGDLADLQVKITSKKHIDETPAVYLDGIKVEVLYETALTHVHPDFARDTILKDEIVDGFRMVTIINNDTKEQEVWYMYLDTVANDTVASSTQASTTELFMNATGTSPAGAHIDGTTTNDTPLATSTPVVDLLKRVWKKFDGKDATIGAHEIIEAIKKQEIVQKYDEILVIPDFGVDTIKRMKGVFLNTVLVQIQRTSVVGTGTAADVTGLSEKFYDELWLYNTVTGAEEKIGTGTSSVAITIAQDSPIGVKDKYLFWLSSEKANVYAYNLEDKKILEKEVPIFDASNGERGEVIFEQIPWKVIVSNQGFSFYSVESGEVFSDEDAGIVEALRAKMGLDAVLDKEELSNLNLPVEADIKP